MKKLKYTNEARKKPTLFISREDIIKLNSMFEKDVSGVMLWTKEIKK